MPARDVTTGRFLGSGKKVVSGGDGGRTVMEWFGDVVYFYLEEKIRERTAEACVVVRDEAKRLAPLRTGKLKKSIFFRVGKVGENIRGIVGSNLFYALWIEMGTKRARGRGAPPLRPRSFLRRALDEKRAEVVKILCRGKWWI